MKRRRWRHKRRYCLIIASYGEIAMTSHRVDFTKAYRAYIAWAAIAPAASYYAAGSRNN